MLKLDRNTENMFLFILENTATKKKENNWLTLINHYVNSSC